MPSILKQLLASDKFVVVAFLFMLPLTIFAAMGKISIADWRHDALWAIGFIVGGTTVEGAATSIGQGMSAPKVPPAPPQA